MTAITTGIFAAALISMPALASPALAENAITPAEHAQGMAEINAAGARLADTLKDPDSARFRQVFIRKGVGKDGQTWIDVCGQVNDKNSYGGFTDWVAFR
ncbi:MAG: hypothetical protein M3T55_13135 [Pseudomonadota bacterium]|nr:hypothetical protein [Pseudomonadota bacterium]